MKWIMVLISPALGHVFSASGINAFGNASFHLFIYLFEKISVENKNGRSYVVEALTIIRSHSQNILDAKQHTKCDYKNKCKMSPTLFMEPIDK